MNKLELFKKNLDMACHNLMYSSANLLMITPRAGDEKEWAGFKAEVEILENLLKEEQLFLEADCTKCKNYTMVCDRCHHSESRDYFERIEVEE